MWQDPTISNEVPDISLHDIRGHANGVQHAIKRCGSSPTPAIELCMWHGLPPILTRQCWTDNAVNFGGNTSPRRPTRGAGALGVDCAPGVRTRTRGSNEGSHRPRRLKQRPNKRRTPRAERAAHGGALQAGRVKTLRRNCTVGNCHPGYPRPVHQPGRQGARAGTGLCAPLSFRAADRVTFPVTCSAAPSQPEPG